jgi:hypothetical protein
MLGDLAKGIRNAVYESGSEVFGRALLGVEIYVASRAVVSFDDIEPCRSRDESKSKR